MDGITVSRTEGIVIIKILVNKKEGFLCLKIIVI